MLPRRHRLRTPAEFSTTLRSGARYGSRNLVVFTAALASEDEPTRVGFLVSKKVGNAVTRNLVKRRLRDKAVSVIEEHSTGKALVVRALPGAASLDWDALSADFDATVRGSLSKHARRR
ncbi:ribonuclease P protein component [Falsarthrobacter nasiphocae]|uniref:Ribonuclease P protein component n=1 Tax=Falsarthrobacter nasiphocae TaxID=189863 RepID=A0AAE4C861_9MICC|nr:ribonuclease P protein component [Falsarthrobacter nasiphocae]MDR6892075.1 ribonuclease P protein component [Falsarthrobacter nasiphocae]